jgi:hypothetical protein
MAGPSGHGQPPETQEEIEGLISCCQPSARPDIEQDLGELLTATGGQTKPSMKNADNVYYVN